LSDIGVRRQKRYKLWDDSSDVGKKLKRLKRPLDPSLKKMHKRSNSVQESKGKKRKDRGKFTQGEVYEGWLLAGEKRGNAVTVGVGWGGGLQYC
jgi:hypothetical protein